MCWGKSKKWSSEVQGWKWHFFFLRKFFFIRSFLVKLVRSTGKVFGKVILVRSALPVDLTKISFLVKKKKSKVVDGKVESTSVV